jgi:hypothetical protein
VTQGFAQCLFDEALSGLQTSIAKVLYTHQVS